MKKFIINKRYYKEPKVDIDETHFIRVERWNCEGDILQLIVRLEGRTSGNLAFMLEEFHLESEAFLGLLRCVYPLEFDCIVEFDPADFDRFYGYVKLKKSGRRIWVDWDSFQPSSTPVSAMRELYHEIDPEEYY